MEHYKYGANYGYNEQYNRCQIFDTTEEKLIIYEKE